MFSQVWKFSSVTYNCYNRERWHDEPKWQVENPFLYADCWNNFCVRLKPDVIRYWWKLTKLKLRVSQTFGPLCRNKHDLTNARNDTEPLPLSGWTKSTPTDRLLSPRRLLHANTPRGSSGDTHCADPTLRDPHLCAGIASFTIPLQIHV